MSRVLYVQYTNPAAYPPLMHSAQMLAGAGFDVTAIGTLKAGDTLRFPADTRVDVQLRRFEGIGWRQKAGYLRYAATVTSWAARHRPRWIYASDALSAPAASVAATVSGARVVYHEHDSPTPSARDSRFQQFVLRSRRRLAGRADICVLPNAGRAAAFERSTGRRNAAVVWNCPARAEVRPPRVAGSGMRVLYHGSIVPARLPESVVHALTRLPASVTLVVAGYETAGHPGYVDRLAAIGRELGVRERLEFAGTFPQRADLLSLCATCDVGLSLMPADTSDVNEQSMAGASNKAFDYLACGLPLVVSDLPDWRTMFVDAGLAEAVDPASAESLASALAGYAADPQARVARGERGRQRILAEWHYERAFQPVLEQMLERSH